MKRMPEKLRKAAVLIASLDERSADALLEQMPPEQAARIRSALVELDELDAEEQQKVMREFLGTRERHVVTSDGVELDLKFGSASGTAAATAPPAPATATAPAPPSQAPQPFEFLKQIAPAELSKRLEQEHPQIAAVVVAHLAPETAAQVLTHLPDALQTEILERVADLESADPEVLRELETQLEKALQYTTDRRSASRPGLDAVAAILAHMEQAKRRALLARLAESDGELVQRIQPAVAPQAPANVTENVTNADPPAAAAKPERLERSHAPVTQKLEPWDEARAPSPGADGELEDAMETFPDDTAFDFSPLNFDDVMQLSNDDLARVFRTADPAITLLALAGAPPEFVDRILRQMSSRDSKQFRKRFSRLGPIRLSDVTIAQQELAAVATQLAERGLVEIPPRRGFAAAA